MKPKSPSMKTQHDWLRKHLSTLLVGLHKGNVTVDECHAAARAAAQINVSFFAEAKMLSLNVSHPSLMEDEDDIDSEGSHPD